jgi:hypothetical protein
MINLLRTLFSWPDGIVVGNLIASALWAGPALLHLDRRHKQLKAHITALHQGQSASPPGGPDDDTVR